MTKLTKRAKTYAGKVDSNKLYALVDALSIVKECATAKFDESIDVAVQLGIDAKKSDQVVRGAVVLPNGTGKTKRVAVFAQGAKAEEARAAGAALVKAPQKVSWGGYSGYFADPDGHLWEVAWNPYLELDKKDALVLP